MDHDDYPFPSSRESINAAKDAYRKHGPWLKFIIVLVIIVAVIAASYYEVEPEEVGVVTRFGKYIKTVDPGPNFKIPIVDHVEFVQAKRQLKQEFGFRTESAGVKSAFRRDPSTLRESMMLTGDLNVAVVEWIVHYQIHDPYQWVFKVRNVEDTLRALSEATMRSIVGDYSVTEVLTKGREEILEKARLHLAELCKSYETGITIQRIELKDSAPPDAVKPSFNEVNQAEQERDRMQNEAWAKYNKEIPKARGEARQIVQEAEGYAIERVNNARGEVERFVALEKEYAQAPNVTRTRLYLETLNEVLPKAGKKIFMDEATKGMVPLLFPLDKSSGQLPGGAGGVR